MSFGWSAGDIIAAGTFVFQVAQALDDVDGAAKEFRDASSFLHQLISALKPLETFAALESRPAYKSDIEREVRLIRKPVESFINDEDVKNLQKNLGVARDSRFRNVHSKLRWHFSTSKKALALQKEVDMHLRVIDTLMQRLTV